MARDRLGGSVRRVPWPLAACRLGEGLRRAANWRLGGGRSRAANWRLGEGLRRAEGRRGPAAEAREAASLDLVSAPRGVACSHGAAWEAAAGRRGHKAPGRDRPDSCRAGNRDGAAWLRPGRATAGPGSTRHPALRAPTLLGLALPRLALPRLATVRRSAGFPGWPGLLASRVGDHPWARRAGRPVSTHSSASARTADRNALRHDRYPRPGYRRGAGPGGAAAMYQAPLTCHARGTPP